MSVSKYRWTEECDTHLCIGDCDFCDYNTEDEEIEPCPFCGGTEFEIFPPKEIYYELLKEHGTACIELNCKTSGCYAHMYDHNNKIKNYDEKCRSLIKRWNTRTYTSTYTVSVKSLE